MKTNETTNEQIYNENNPPQMSVSFEEPGTMEVQIGNLGYVHIGIFEGAIRVFLYDQPTKDDEPREMDSIEVDINEFNQ